jgi:hypothetical protein
MPPARRMEGWGAGRMALGAERTSWGIAGRQMVVGGTCMQSLPKKFLCDPAFIESF